jgi:predicted GIY-YIG superfamily endonuclease
MSNSFRELVVEVEAKRGYVYLIRNGDLHKIGVTMDLERRMKELRPDEIIAVYQAVNVAGVERLLHSRYKDVRLPQTEYFRLRQEQVREARAVLNSEVVWLFWTAPIVNL